MPKLLINKSDIKNDTVYINGTEYNHIVKVLRHKNGDRLTLFDGASLEYQGTIKNILPDKLRSKLSARTLLIPSRIRTLLFKQTRN